ncbi:hypothetical protein HU761_20330 [Pseudomonas sp. SWRI59]|nr:hypothetical protein [Pseudomonas sp. SWRI59]MBC3508282.1 hypothetical protein [Pseudomonas sp. SWRI68]
MDIRVIAATHCDLPARIASGQFRAALCAPALEGADGIALASLFPEFFQQPQAPTQPLAFNDNLRSLGKAAEAAHARRTLASYDGNMEQAARSLGVSRSTLWRRLRAQP